MLSKRDNFITEIKWFVPLELSHSSYIYTSLIEFCKLRKIPLKISSKNLNKRGLITITNDSQKSSNHFNPKVTWVQIIFNNKNNKMIAFDLNDNPNFFGKYALERADIYIKRCYQDEIINVLSNEYRFKIKSMGLPFMVRPKNLLGEHKVQFMFYIFKMREIFKLDRRLIKRSRFFRKKAIKHFKDFKNARTILDFNKYNPEILGNIFFQKRLFEENSHDVTVLNAQRVRIIALLKKQFPDNFYGGLQRNRISESNYPELISNIDGNPHAFLAAMRNCGICIYTNGLKGSPGWTLPEFLSQGKCIVAQKLENKLPHLLIHDKHVMFYSNESELVAICRELIMDPEKRQTLSKNARKYYDQYIDPQVFFKNLLKDTIRE